MPGKNLVKEKKRQNDSCTKAVFVAGARESVLTLQESKAMSACCNAFTNKFQVYTVQWFLLQRALTQYSKTKVESSGDFLCCNLGESKRNKCKLEMLTIIYFKIN